MKILAILIITVITNQMACNPQNNADCRLEASKAPTREGIIVGIRAIEDQFPTK